MISGRSATLLLILLPVCVSADQRIFTRHTDKNVTVEFPVPTDTTTIWLKRPGSDKYLFYCRDGHPTRPEDQESSFKDRVEVTDCDRINGTISVTVSNLIPGDSGPYEFHCGDRDGFNETIFLNVTNPGRTGEHVGLIVGVSLFSAGLLVVVGVCVGLKIYRSCRKQHGPDPKVPDEEQALDSHDRHLQTCEEKLLMKMP